MSYTQHDRAWAEWVAWQLEAARYTTVLQAWDFRPGDNFVARMRDALQQADRTIAVLSPAYLDSPYGTDEWTAAFLHDPDGQQATQPGNVLDRHPEVPAQRSSCHTLSTSRSRSRCQVAQAGVPLVDGDLRRVGRARISLTAQPWAFAGLHARTAGPVASA